MVSNQDRKDLTKKAVKYYRICLICYIVLSILIITVLSLLFKKKRMNIAIILFLLWIGLSIFSVKYTFKKCFLYCLLKVYKDDLKDYSEDSTYKGYKNDYDNSKLWSSDDFKVDGDDYIELILSY